MTKSEFIALIETKDDIHFEVRGKGLTILTWTDGGISIGEWNKPETRQQFDTERDLVDGFLVNGTPLGALAEEIVIVECI